MVGATRTCTAGERQAWVAGIVFVVAIVAETAVAFGISVNQNDSAPKIVNARSQARVVRLSTRSRRALHPVPDDPRPRQCGGRLRQKQAPGEGNPRFRSPPPLLSL